MNSAIAGSRIPVVLRPAHLRLYTSSSSSKRTENFYELLELPSRNADQKAIKSQFYKLSMKYHPDRNPNDDAAHTKFIKLNEAYRTLSKENTRREYDRSLDRSSGATTNRGGSGPRGPAMRRTYEPLRPDDWILYRKPGAGRSRIFDFEEHARQHYNNEDFESEARSSARKNARQRYYEELRADQKRQPRVFLTTVILSFGLWLIIHTGAAQMLFLDDEDVDTIAEITVPASKRKPARSEKRIDVSAGGPHSENFVLGPGLHISLLTQSSSMESGTTIWQSGRHLAWFIHGMPRKSFAGKLWVDLGTGCGIVGLAAAHSGVPNVYLTDTPSVIQQGYIARNVYNNPIEEGSSSVSVLELDWFKIDALSEDSGLPLFGQTVDTVTGADITYSRDAIAPLVSVISRLNPNRVLISFERRDPLVIEDFMTRMESSGFVRKRLRSRCPPTEQIDPNVELWIFRRKKAPRGSWTDMVEI